MSTATAKAQPGVSPSMSNVEAFQGRLLHSLSGAFDLFAIYLGDRLGFYHTLATHRPMTAAELAQATRTHPRYVREWLEQQAATGILEPMGGETADDRRYGISAAHAEVLADPESLNYLAPMAQILNGVVRPMDKLIAAFRSGGGVSWEEYGADAREGQARINRTMFLQQLGQEWIPAMGDIHRRLGAPGARVADIGCGAGWSGIGVARCYPTAQVDGFDLDEASIGMARANARDYAVTDRVFFQHRDAADPSLRGQYDLAMALECIHDMSNPVAALRTMRRMLKPGGAVLVVDERVNHTFQPGPHDPAGSDVDWMMYGWSILCCLPAGMSEHPSACTGTVMRPETLERYAREAGFERFEILPVDHLFFRFYRLG
ncbi:MAG: class I SAM-dependent methyltransferase [Bryobacteraceae bacterium]